MKPDWKDAPTWANWLAMDGDGDWYWFEREPEWKFDCWVLGGRLLFAERDFDGEDWDFAYSTKEARP